MTINLPIKLAHPDAKVPTKNNFEDAGWDLYSVEDRVIPAGRVSMLNDQHPSNWHHDYTANEVTVVKTGIHVQIPKGYVGLIWDRSGMAIKNQVHRVAGVIDSGYTGELMVGLTNFGWKDHEISSGDKIAQLILQEIPLHVTWEIVNELDESNRGEKGFGSSGK